MLVEGPGLGPLHRLWIVRTVPRLKRAMMSWETSRRFLPRRNQWAAAHYQSSAPMPDPENILKTRPQLPVLYIYI